MSNLISELLESWGLTEISQKFVDNGVEIQHVKLLTDDLLRELCPKISTRLELKEKIKEYLTAETNSSTITSVTHSAGDLDSNIDESSVPELLACRPPFPEFDLRTLLSTSLTSKHRSNLTDIISRRIFTRIVNQNAEEEKSLGCWCWAGAAACDTLPQATPCELSAVE